MYAENYFQESLGLGVDEFERTLKMGLGRTVLYLKNHDSRPYENAILGACLHNLAYDPQLECDRSEYLLELIALTGRKDFYRDAVLDALRASYGSKADRAQQVELAYKLIADDDHEVRQFLDELAFQPPYDEVGDEAPRPQKSLDLKNVSYSQLKKLLTDRTVDSIPFRLSSWGKQASDDDILKAARDLLALSDDHIMQINAYLDIFYRRAFPLVPTRLIEWAKAIGDQPLWTGSGRNPEAHMALKALNALEQVYHPAVGELALWLIQAQKSAGRAVGLLAANFAAGDWGLIANLTLEPLTDENYHDLACSVCDVFEAHPDSEAVPALENLYEYGWCSYCRYQIVGALISLNALSPSLLLECRHDASTDIRTLVSSLGKSLTLDPEF